MGDTTETIHHRTCHLCEAMCGLNIHVRDGRVALVRGDQEDVFSKGYLCPKGSAIGHVHHDADRLTRPRIRRGPGPGDWEEVTWEEAFAEVDRRFQQVVAAHGRDALAVYSGNPSAHSHHTLLFTGALLKSLGTKNFFSASTVDQMPKHVSSGLMFGSPDMIAVPDLDRTHFLLMLGADPMESNGSLCTAADFPGRLRALKDRGGTLVVVDPRRSKTAELATAYLPIRPGTDALLLLAIAHVLVAEGLADPGRLRDLSAGIDTADTVLARFTPEAVASATAITADTIRGLARDLAAAPSAAVYSRIGVHTNTFGTLGAWATDLINVLTGNLDRPGGAMFAHPPNLRPGKGSGRGFSTGRWRSRVNDAPEVRSEFPVAQLPSEVLTPGDGQIRALITVAGNPALSAPDSAGICAALESLDLMVSVDPWLNETTRFAHVILPPPGPLARSQYDLPFTRMAVRNLARWSPPVFEHEGPAEWEILAKLALIASGMGPDADPSIVGELVLNTFLAKVPVGDGAEEARQSESDPAALLAESGRSYPDRVIDVMIRSGTYGDGFGERTEPRAFDDTTVEPLSMDVLAAHPHGIDLGPLRPELPAMLSTASGKIELFPEEIVHDLDRLAASLADGDGITTDHPLLLIGRRHLRSNNSWMHNTKVLVKGKERCVLQMHPSDADRFEVSGQSTVTLTSATGSVVVPLELSEAMMPGVVSMPHGWGHDAAGVSLTVAREHAGVNSNLLTDPAPLDPLSGNARLNGIPVSVSPTA
jgi:anaerobic selenocysteine-containing dehydrogenase